MRNQVHPIVTIEDDLEELDIDDAEGEEDVENLFKQSLQTTKGIQLEKKEVTKAVPLIVTKHDNTGSKDGFAPPTADKRSVRISTGDDVEGGGHASSNSSIELWPTVSPSNTKLITKVRKTSSSKLMPPMLTLVGVKNAMTSKSFKEYIAGGEEDNDEMVMGGRTDFRREGFRLTFKDPDVEKAYRKHINVVVETRVRNGLYILISTDVLFILSQVVFELSPNDTTIAVSRCISISVMLAFLGLLKLRWKAFIDRIDGAALTVHFILSTLQVIEYLVCSLEGTVVEDINYFGFFKGRWSLPCSLVYIIVVFNISGLRFTGQLMVFLHHFLLMLVLCLGFFWDTRGLYFGTEVSLLPIIASLNSISSQLLEKHIRNDFVLRVKIQAGRRKCTAVLDSMLPRSVSRMLQNGYKAEDVVESFDNVTILFGYITEFKELTTSVDTEQLVSFVNSMFTDFDHSSDLHNVYKLEAIEASYLCCAGAPEREASGGAHADRCVDMAITMLSIAHHASVPSKAASGEYDVVVDKPQLKIGIHTGPVVAGVSGVKSYSYHLFGDTVNTASRMGSTGAKSKVQLSEPAYNALSEKYKSKCVARGGVEVKGKGVMYTYWLETSEQDLKKRYTELRRFIRSQTDYDAILSNSYNQDTQIDRPSPTELVVENVRVKQLKFVMRNPNATGPPPPQSDAALGLTQGLDTRYCVRHNKTHLRSLKRMLVLVFITTTIASISNFDVSGVSTSPKTVTYLRAFAICTVFLAFIFTFVPRFLEFMQPSTSMMTIIFAFLINLNLYYLPTYHMMDIDIIMITTAALLVDLRTPYALVVCVAMCVQYTIIMFSSGYHDWTDCMGYSLMIYTTTLVAMYACYIKDREFRYDYLHTLILEGSKIRSEHLLKNMLPNPHHVKNLLEDKPVQDQLDDVTVMFTDLKGYTEWCSKQQPMEVYRVLNKVYTAFDKHIEPLGVFKLDTIGDAFVVVAGLDGYSSKKEHCMAMVKFAFRMLFELERLKAEDGLKFEMRVGIHAGPTIGSVIGIKKPRFLVWGKTPLIANELEALGTPGKVLISNAAFRRLDKDALKESGLEFHPSKMVTLKTRSSTEAITTHMIQMDSIKALTQLAREIRAESNPQAPTQALSRSASSPTNRSRTLFRNILTTTGFTGALGSAVSSSHAGSVNSQASSAPASPPGSPSKAAKQNLLANAASSGTPGTINMTINSQVNGYSQTSQSASGASSPSSAMGRFRNASKRVETIAKMTSQSSKINDGSGVQYTRQASNNLQASGGRETAQNLDELFASLEQSTAGLNS